MSSIGQEPPPPQPIAISCDRDVICDAAAAAVVDPVVGQSASRNYINIITRGAAADPVYNSQSEQPSSNANKQSRGSSSDSGGVIQQQQHVTRSDK